MIYHVRMWDIYGYLWSTVSVEETTRQLPNSFEDPTAASSLSSFYGRISGTANFSDFVCYQNATPLSEATGDFFLRLTQNGWFPHVLCPWNSFKTPLPYYHPKHLSLVGPVPPVAPWMTHCRSSVTSSPARKTRSRSVALGSCHMLIKARKSWQKLPVVPCFMVNMMRNHRIFGDFFGIPQFWWLKSS